MTRTGTSTCARRRTACACWPRDRRHRGRQPERLRQGAEADRRRDQRLLRARLLLDQPRPAEAHAKIEVKVNGRRVVADVVRQLMAPAESSPARAASHRLRQQARSRSGRSSRSRRAACGTAEGEAPKILDFAMRVARFEPRGAIVSKTLESLLTRRAAGGSSSDRASRSAAPAMCPRSGCRTAACS